MSLVLVAEGGCLKLNHRFLPSVNKKMEKNKSVFQADFLMEVLGGKTGKKKKNVETWTSWFPVKLNPAHQRSGLLQGENPAASAI